MGLLTNLEGRKKVLNVIVAHCSKLCILSYIIGIIWLCALSDPSFNARVYFSENALLPGLVEAEYKDHKLASSLFQELLHVPQDDLSNPALHNWLLGKMEDIGLHTYRQNFTVHLPFPGAKESQTFDGVNVYGILRAPRIAGTEAVVISIPYNNGRNRGALALMLSFAWHCRKKAYWSKDIIFVVTDKAELGMQAWLDAYHGVPNSYISSAPLQGYSGSIQAALNLEFDAEKVSYFKILIEGVNGQLPNLDLVNTVFRLCRQERIPAALHTEGYHRNLGHWGDSLHSLVSMVMMMFYQASGRPSGNHGLFHRYRIEALTMRGGEDGRYGRSFLETGKVIEGIFRSLNNLLEQFHQSFFFYLLPQSGRYVSIGLYMPPFGCLLVGPLIMAVVLWSRACSGPATLTQSEPEQEEAAASEEGDGEKAEGHRQNVEGHGQNVEGHGQNVEGHGQNVEGHGQNVEGHGQNVEGHGQNVEGHGQNVEGHGQNVEGHGQNVEGHRQNVEGHGQNLEGHGQNVEGHGQNVEGHGQNVEGHGQNQNATNDRQDTIMSNETPNLEDKVAFLRYPHNIASVVPVVMATHVGGALVFYSPDVGYKVGEIIGGVDPLSCAFAGLSGTFVALVLFPFVTRCSSEDVPNHETIRSHCMLKCAAFVLFSVIMSTLAAINFSLAFLVSMFLVPVFLFVVPAPGRSRRVVQAFLLLLVSPPMILFLLSLAFNTLVSDGNFDSSDLLSLTLDTVRGCVLSSVREARMLGTWSYAMTCLGILPNWLLFWYVAWQ